MVIRKDLSWQYNGVAPMSEIVEWCREHLDPIWQNSGDTIYFSSEQDKIAFLLRWQ